MLYVILWIFSTLLASLAFFGVIYRRFSGVCLSKNRLDDKTVIITGATSGIGRETAKDLAGRGARVVLACRNVQKAEDTKDWIVRTTGNKNIEVRHLDVSDLESVRKFSEETLKKEKRIDVLINNAGAVFIDKRLSKQGHELTIATNHFGHFLLTNLLLGLIIQSAPSRIINVSSVGHKRYNLDIGDVHFKKRKYGALKAYFQSKLCNILFTKYLAHHLFVKDVTVNSLHPGTVATDICIKEGTWLGWMLNILTIISGKTSELGAQTVIHLAVSDEVRSITGEYFVDCKIAQTSRKALDPGLAKQLWELSEEETGLRNEEKHF